MCYTAPKGRERHVDDKILGFPDAAFTAGGGAGRVGTGWIRCGGQRGRVACAVSQRPGGVPAPGAAALPDRELAWFDEHARRCVPRPDGNGGRPSRAAGADPLAPCAGHAQRARHRRVERSTDRACFPGLGAGLPARRTSRREALPPSGRDGGGTAHDARRAADSDGSRLARGLGMSASRRFGPGRPPRARAARRLSGRVHRDEPVRTGAARLRRTRELSDLLPLLGRSRPHGDARVPCRGPVRRLGGGSFDRLRTDLVRARLRSAAADGHAASRDGETRMRFSRVRCAAQVLSRRDDGREDRRLHGEDPWPHEGRDRRHPEQRHGRGSGRSSASWGRARHRRDRFRSTSRRSSTPPCRRAWRSRTRSAISSAST